MVQLPQERSGVGVPQRHRPIHAAAGEQLPVGSEGHRAHHRGRSGEYPLQRPALRVPEPDLAGTLTDSAPAGEGAAVGRDDE